MPTEVDYVIEKRNPKMKQKQNQKQKNANKTKTLY